MTTIHTSTLAEIYARQGHLAKAREIYLEVLATDPGLATARCRLAEIEARLAEDTLAQGAASARLARLRTLLARVRGRRWTGAGAT